VRHSTTVFRDNSVKFLLIKNDTFLLEMLHATIAKSVFIDTQTIDIA
jgi:hypothetical protein